MTESSLTYIGKFTSIFDAVQNTAFFEKRNITHIKFTNKDIFKVHYI